MAGNDADAVRDVIYKTALLLDDEKWDEWLALCEDDFQYAIKAFSPEIHHDMTYLEGSRKDLSTMTEMLPKHNTDHSPLTRHTVVYSIDVDDAKHIASAVSSFTVHQTLLDGINSHVDAGESHLFLVGKYYDKFSVRDGEVKFTERVVRLNTRRLDKGSHWPI
jgi:methanesulfonate monooxygenase small subunit